MCVGPNRVITGVLKAAAKCRGPESVVIKSAARRTQALVRPMPSGLIGQADDMRMAGRPHDLARGARSLRPAEDQDDDSASSASRRASSAKCAVGQLLAGPKAPPVFRQTTFFAAIQAKLRPGRSAAASSSAVVASSSRTESTGQPSTRASLR